MSRHSAQVLLTRTAATSVQMAAADLRIGDVYRSGQETPSYLRIVWIEPALGNATALMLGVNGSPTPLSTINLASEIASGALVWTDDHPFKRAPLNSAAAQLDRPESDMARVVRPKNAPRERPQEQKLVERHRALIAHLMAGAQDGSLFAIDYGQAVNKHASAIGASAATVTRVMRTWLEFGMTDAALGSARHRCGGKKKRRTYSDKKPGPGSSGALKGVPLNPEVCQALDWGVRWLKANPYRPYVDGFIEMNKRHFAIGTELRGDVEIAKLAAPHLRPTEWQFLRYTRRELPDRERKRTRRGEKHYQLNVRPVLGDTSGRSYGPGSMSHIDSSPMAHILVDRATRSQSQGQPRVYFVIDDFSWAIVGKQVTFGAERNEDALLAMADSFVGVIKAPRVPAGQTPLADVRKFLCWEIFSDKGAAYTSWLNERVITRLRGAAANPQGGRPDHRGGGEQRFNMANQFLNWLPGAITKRFRGRADRKRGRDAAFTLPEYEQLLDEFILHHNSTFRPPNAPRESFQADGRPRTAFNLILWGFKNRGAASTVDADAVRLCLYEQVLATVDSKGHGLNIDGAFYEPVQHVPGLRLDREAPGGGWVALRDKERLGTAWLLTDEGTSVVKLNLVRPKALSELTVQEWKASNRLHQASKREGRAEDLSQRSASIAVLTEIAATAGRVHGEPGSRKLNGAARAQEALAQSVDQRNRIGALMDSVEVCARAEPLPLIRPKPSVSDDDEYEIEALELFQAAGRHIKDEGMK